MKLNNEIKVVDYVDKKTGCHVVKAMTTYKGSLVVAYAKCDPADTFDLQVGTNLACLRLKQKVAKKRYSYRKAYLKELKRQLAWLEQDRTMLTKLIEREAVYCADCRVDLYNISIDLQRSLAEIE
jgi:hypothetical protein